MEQGGAAMPPAVLIPIADGSEEIEAVCLIDVLRRAGADATVASVDGLTVTASRGVKLVADCPIEDCMHRQWDLIALPGGMPGAKHLRDSSALAALLVHQRDAGRYYGAICASPAVVLKPLGLLPPGPATAHPAFMEKMGPGAPSEEPVVVNENCITSRGPGTAMAFALKLVEILWDRAHAEAVSKPMVLLHGLV